MSVTLATENDISFIVDVSRRNFDAIGFLPNSRLEQYIRAGQALRSDENGDAAGFLVFGAGWPRLRIYQACVQYDARRREHGLGLVAALVIEARARGCDSVSLWCADDLEANAFWRSAGFTFARQKLGGARRGRRLNLWILRIPEPLQSSLLPPLAGAHRVTPPTRHPGMEGR